MKLFSISEAAERAGISAYTIRYYEKAGILPPPKRRQGNKRFYTDGDIAFLKFLKSLKQTGMTLADIQEFVQDGCILEKTESLPKEEIMPSLNLRIRLLSKHLEKMEQQRKELDTIILMTKSKLEIYHSLMDGEVEKS
ncbi:MerR family transcriptional regulator [Peribacillus sp. B-H-3]|jgi:MerR family transcriptional regulator, aldehyde-responsive regulator|uniref:MerR family transcriptional regulator n=1 Tax=Peribacillus sp. B-H-3 TaxID=3400420 RepID=UPI003B014300